MKSLSVAWKAALAAGTQIPRLFVKGDFESGEHGFWTDVGTVSVGGVSYAGSGAIATVSSIAGVTDLSIPGMTVTMSGLDDGVLASFFDEVWHQRGMQAAIGLLDPATRNLVDTPDVVFAGYMDDAQRKGGADKQATLEITCEDSSRRMTRTFQNVRSDADQRERDADDGFFKFTTVVGETDVYWNQPTPKTASKPKG